ncbi:polysaccharide biosynthesis tyrosine autokinase [Novosphingobium sp. P6W]|uniref:GumC family protein n=1 Tax=Novosphingobium sp. P6W TaxID=1609758 RepID=UPI0013B35AB5|nr:polysaccharide biosynthesis tyrosine autokinase [Novosphingobium sp. P6W]
MKDAILDRDGQGAYSENQGDGIDFTIHLKSLINVVRRNALLITGVVIGVVIVGIVITMLMTPTYKATAQILIEDQADQIIEGSELQKAAASSDTDRFLQTQLGIVKSRALARSVVQSGRFDRDAGFFEALGSRMPEAGAPNQKLDVARQDAAIKALLDVLSVDMAPDSRIAAITITSRQPGLSAKLANSYAERFIEYNLSRKFDSSSYARQFLADQLEETRVKLTQSERDLNQYARAAGLIRISSEGETGRQESALSVTNDMLVQLNNAAASATAERIAAENRWKTLAKQPPLAVSEVNSNAAVMQLVADKARAEAALADELSKHLEGYSTVKAKRAEISELDRRITSIANAIKSSAEVNYRASQEKEQALVGEVNSLRSDALREQDRGVQYSVLKRVADTYRTLYESLLSRYNQINATAGSASNNVTIVDRADAPRDPSSPRLFLNVALALILGFVCAAVAVALKEVLDDAIRSPDDVEKKLGMPLLGLVPLRKEGDLDRELGDRRSSASEAYRSLVTNLRYTTANGLPKVLAITSSREAEGKSTTARAVAMDIAMLGKKVLIVDTDLRRPTLHHTMNDSRGSGLTDLLTGQKTFDEVVHQAEHAPTLSYITGLPSPPDPALILAGEGFAAFIAQVRSQFDMVVLDCPPLLGLSDAPLLAKHSDGVLFVIDASSFHRGAVKSALRRLSLINANVLGVVLNRFTPKSGGDDYSYYAYNYYSYGTNQE